MRLFKFQKDAVSQLTKAFKTEKNVCLGWYTGAGKTNVFIQLMKEALERDSSLKFAVSCYFTTEVKEQIYERIKAFGLGDKTQVISGPTGFDLSKNIFVFIPQGIFRWPESELKVDYLIIDEAHAGVDEACSMLRNIRAKISTKDTKTLLVSATPWDTLLLKEFEGTKVLKRPLDQGLADGLITDFRFHCEEAQVEFKDDDFSRSGDLKLRKDVGEFSILKSVCKAKVSYIEEKYEATLGKKVLVICPPGNGGEIARFLAKEFKGLPFLMGGGGYSRKHDDWDDTSENLDRFKTDKTRYLFVINKCCVGFDMQELCSVIDLTMSRNIRVLAQRVGRIARKNGTVDKNYFYVYDKSLMKNRLEWLLLTMTDFCLGAYDGWNTKTAKYRPLDAKADRGRIFPQSFTLKEVINLLREDGAIETRECLRFIDAARPRKWTTETALIEARKFKSRTDLWRDKPTVYKWLRLNNKPEMDALFPHKYRVAYWSAETLEAFAKEWTGKIGRKEFRAKCGGDYWGYKTKANKRIYDKILNEYFPSKLARWDEKSAFKYLKTVKRWRELRVNGARSWMTRHGTEAKWKKIWLEMNVKARRGKIKQRIANVA